MPAPAPVAPRGQVHGHPGLLEQRRELPGTIGSFYPALLGTESAKRKPSYAWDRYLRAQGYDRAGEFSGAPLKCLVPLLEESYVGGA